MDGVINKYFVFFKIKFKWAILFYLIKKYQSSPNHLLQNIQLKKKKFPGFSSCSGHFHWSEKVGAVSQSILVLGFHLMLFIVLKKTYWKHFIPSVQTCWQLSNFTENIFEMPCNQLFPESFFFSFISQGTFFF